MFDNFRRLSNLFHSYYGPFHNRTELDRNDFAYYDNTAPDYSGGIGPQAGFDFDYFGYGLAPSGTVPNGTLEHPW